MAAGRRDEAPLRAGLAALLCALHVWAACQDATVTQELLKEGFHRDLLVKVELGVLGEDAGGCAVAARTRLPPGIYVDPYELASLQQHNLTKAVLIPDVIDVEAPEYLATDLLLLLYMEPDPRCSRCFKAALPVHGRYHRPAEESEEALIVLKSPEVLVCCCDNRLSAECWKPAEVEAPCSGKTDSPCQWYSVTHKPIPADILDICCSCPKTFWSFLHHRESTQLFALEKTGFSVICKMLILRASLLHAVLHTYPQWQTYCKNKDTGDRNGYLLKW
ncbi:phosphatidylinositol-glycan biosynthesis class X protein isoform X2 [Aquila chrysaetos chrysaetos]|uniref:phosphatidylinositol-glycan biosynthesis class X protein isoform X2 n=1 Tax=Aquila chrysaetos chrysaetos TaxID=223781 RepID=UPI0005D051F0|nr:phosphatidylinositol-glycan biosynthesis class X protein isoform X2 [Aquila chrysaetos chrysaetos]